MLLAIPFLRKLENKVKEAIVFIGLILISYTTIYTGLENANMYICKMVDNGLVVGPIWFCYLYIFAEVIFIRNRYEKLLLWTNRKLVWGLSFLISYILMYLCVVNNFTSVRNMISPLCLFSAYCIFKVFDCMRDNANKLINYIAGCTFGVYLFHTNRLVRDKIWIDLLHMDWFAVNSRLYCAMAFISVIVIFLIAIVLEYFRKKIENIRFITRLKSKIIECGNKFYRTHILSN